MLENLQNLNFLGNNLYAYLKTILIFLGIFFFLKIFKTIILARLKKISQKTKNDLDDLLIKVIKSIKNPIYLILALYFALKPLYLNPWLIKTINVILVIGIIYALINAIEEKKSDLSFKSIKPELQETFSRSEIKVFKKKNVVGFDIVDAENNTKWKSLHNRRAARHILSCNCCNKWC